MRRLTVSTSSGDRPRKNSNVSWIGTRAKLTQFFFRRAPRRAQSVSSVQLKGQSMSTSGRIQNAVCVIGIAGGSGSGKTTISRRLAANLGEDRVACLSQDSYYHDGRLLSAAERQSRNYDHPESIDSRLLAQHIQTLCSAQAVDVPSYDFATHTRRAESTRVEPRPIVLVDGILLLANAALRQCLSLRLYVDAAPDIRLMRRIRRDTLERGRALSSVLEQWETSVKPMHDRFVEPSRSWADMVIADGREREASVQMLLHRLRD